MHSENFPSSIWKAAACLPETLINVSCLMRTRKQSIKKPSITSSRKNLHWLMNVKLLRLNLFSPYQTFPFRGFASQFKFYVWKSFFENRASWKVIHETFDDCWSISEFETLQGISICHKNHRQMMWWILNEWIAKWKKN